MATGMIVPSTSPSIRSNDKFVKKPTVPITPPVAAVEVDGQLLKRVIEVKQMEQQDREHILYTLDALIKNVKLKSIA